MTRDGTKTMMVALMQYGAGQNQSGMLCIGPSARTVEPKRWITIMPVIRHQSFLAHGKR
jgi:microcompartment protein CcmK/EutM